MKLKIDEDIKNENHALNIFDLKKYVKLYIYD